MDDVNDGLETFDSLMQQGLIASAADRGAQAIALFSQAALLAPTAGMPHFLIGAEHAAMENYAQAEVAFSDAIALAPAMAIARYQLGLLQFSLVRIEVALRTWKPLLDMPEPNPYRGFIHGFAALAQDEPQAAEFHFKEGLAKNRAFQEACAINGQAGVITRMLSDALAGDIEQVLAGLAEDATGPEGAVKPSKQKLEDNGDSAGHNGGHVDEYRIRPNTGTGAQSGVGAQGASASNADTSASEHFLLSNYSPQGRPN
ncbi:MAG: hypothetical protein ACRYGK_11465 [Janthinobacterium lividum]